MGVWRPCLADITGDGLVDVWQVTSTRKGPRPMDAQPEGDSNPSAPPSHEPTGPTIVGDFDLDGYLDEIWPIQGAVAAGWLGLGNRNGKPWTIPGAKDPTHALLAAELDRTLDKPLALEILRVTDTGLEIWHNPKGAGNGMRIAYKGKKDNPDGIGAVVEVRAEGIYRRIFLRGGTELVGLGSAKQADVVRVTWPNGVVRTDLDLAAGDPFAADPSLAEQTEGLIGSCPFLYTWNGAEYEFISDVLGITPLGLPMGPGMLVPPDHDEYVLIRGEQLQAKDGFFEMQFTEELREVTYLDRAELLVVDHPVGTEFEPNERFSFPPFPAPHAHTARAPLAPLTALASDGADHAPELRALDDVHAA
ncbi:MAG: hypothetical protein KDB61_14995, partial [Planctomycetes bacterium]|nr:hypothetical protein [Planctomycetota bacterium]